MEWALLIIISLIIIIVIVSFVIAHIFLLRTMIVNYITLTLRIQYPIVNIQLSMSKIVAVGVEPTRPKQGSTIFESANSTHGSVFR